MPQLPEHLLNLRCGTRDLQLVVGAYAERAERFAPAQEVGAVLRDAQGDEGVVQQELLHPVRGLRLGLVHLPGVPES